MDKQFYTAMDNAVVETAENRRRSIRNFFTKNTEDLQPYDNKAQLEMVSLMRKLLSEKNLKAEKVETLKQNRDLEIHYARYGTDVQKDDVVDFLEERISSHQRLNLFVDNDNLGGDFYPGKEKQLHIIYTFNGILYEGEFNEGQVLSIPKLVTETPETNIIPILIALFIGIIVGLFIKEHE